eukprot:CAMPEP_0182571148 /NCGR_PEP_ID=MMETSP1324-20130603/12332_1 /TAXON_ID=236786 /ORGANISM="Florenciella sp., Strain RCC1587" /LENGTH=56 /DNA_ID=CAMNT_0024785663 /DNA_START=614 /DNA_END=784 /DNA_ORIENTATION=+
MSGWWRMSDPAGQAGIMSCVGGAGGVAARRVRGAAGHGEWGGGVQRAQAPTPVLKS